MTAMESRIPTPAVEVNSTAGSEKDLPSPSGNLALSYVGPTSARPMNNMSTRLLSILLLSLLPALRLMAQATPPEVKLVGLICGLSQNRVALRRVTLHDGEKDVLLAEGERVEDLEVIRIAPGLGTVDLTLGSKRLQLSFRRPGEWPSRGLMLEDAPLATVLSLYGPFAHRTLLCSGKIPDAVFTLRTAAATDAEAARAIEKALAEKEISSVPDGDKFLLVLTKSEARTVKPRSSQIRSADNAGDAVLFPPGALRLIRSDVGLVLDLYAGIAGGKRDRNASLRLAVQPVDLVSQTPLTKEESLYALEMLLKLRGLKIENAADGMKLVPMGIPPPASSAER